MTKEEFEKLKIGDWVYAQIVDVKRWVPCIVYGKSTSSASLMSAVICDQSDGTFLCRSSVTRTASEMHTIDYFLKNDLIRDASDDWSLKKLIDKANNNE